MTTRSSRYANIAATTRKTVWKFGFIYIMMKPNNLHVFMAGDVMDWLERMNAALDYIDANLAGDIDIAVAARGGHAARNIISPACSRSLPIYLSMNIYGAGG